MVAVATYWFLSTALLGALDPASTEKIRIEVAPKMGFSELAHELKENEVIRYAWSLELLARFKRQDTKIKAGEYEFSPSQTPRDVLAKLIAGDMIVRQVTVKEGSNLL